MIAGAATAIGLSLVTRKAKAQTMPAPGFDPTKTYGETTLVPLAVPSGWRRATGTEVATLPELGVAANALRNTPGFTSMQYGTLSSFVASDGNTYATWVEQHYHDPGGSIKPWGYHHGVTILAAT